MTKGEGRSDIREGHVVVCRLPLTSGQSSHRGDASRPFVIIIIVNVLLSLSIVPLGMFGSHPRSLPLARDPAHDTKHDTDNDGLIATPA